MDKNKFNKIYIDGDYLFNVSQEKLKHKTTTTEGLPSGGVFGFLTCLSCLKKRHSVPFEDFTIVFNSPSSENARRKILKSYRVDKICVLCEGKGCKKCELKKQIEATRLDLVEFLPILGFKTLQPKNYSAYDVITNQAVNAATEYKVLIFSNNSNFYYITRPDRIGLKKSCGSFAFYSSADIGAKDPSGNGLMGKDFLVWLAMVGKKDDNLKGMHHTGPLTASKLLEEYGAQSFIDRHYQIRRKVAVLSPRALDKDVEGPEPQPFGKNYLEVTTFFERYDLMEVFDLFR